MLIGDYYANDNDSLAYCQLFWYRGDHQWDGLKYHFKEKFEFFES